MDSDADPGHGLKAIECEYSGCVSFNITGHIQLHEDTDSIDFTTSELRDKLLEHITAMSDQEFYNTFDCTEARSI